MKAGRGNQLRKKCCAICGDAIFTNIIAPGTKPTLAMHETFVSALTFAICYGLLLINQLEWYIAIFGLACPNGESNH